MDGVGLKFYEIALELQTAPITLDPSYNQGCCLDFHGSNDALLAVHYYWYGVWMEEVSLWSCKLHP